MSEQLYRIENRGHRDGEMFVSRDGTNAYIGTLVPVPEVFDLGWACREMVRNPMREYRCDECEAKNRWNPDEGDFEYKWPDENEWFSCAFTDGEITSTSWHAVEAVETPEPVQSLEQRVAVGEQRLAVLEQEVAYLTTLVRQEDPQ